VKAGQRLKTRLKPARSSAGLSDSPVRTRGKEFGSSQSPLDVPPGISYSAFVFLPSAPEERGSGQYRQSCKWCRLKKLEELKPL